MHNKHLPVDDRPIAYDDALLFSARDTALVRQLAESDSASDYERVRLW